MTTQARQIVFNQLQYVRRRLLLPPVDLNDGEPPTNAPVPVGILIPSCTLRGNLREWPELGGSSSRPPLMTNDLSATASTPPETRLRKPCLFGSALPPPKRA